MKTLIDWTKNETHVRIVKAPALIDGVSRPFYVVQLWSPIVGKFIAQGEWDDFEAAKEDASTWLAAA